MANAPFGKGQEMTREEYIAQLAELEKQEKANQKEQEPVTEGPQEPAQKRQMIFHDFDYINPITMRPEGLDN